MLCHCENSPSDDEVVILWDLRKVMRVDCVPTAVAAAAGLVPAERRLIG
jgi:hypothetical protein